MKKSEIILCFCVIGLLFLASVWIGILEFDFNDAALAFRDSYEYRTMRQGLLPLLCSFLIIVCSAILLSLDSIRIINHRRTRGLVIIALFGLDAIFYSFVKAEIFNLFFGNQEFFITLEEVSYILMPVFVSGFFFRGFKIHYPITIRIMFYTSVAIAMISLFLFPWWKEFGDFLHGINFIWNISLISLMMQLLFKWRQQSPDTRQIFYDECALICLLLSVFFSATRHTTTEFNTFDMFQILSVTGYFIFVVIQHVQIMLAEYHALEMQRTRLLKEQNLELVVASQLAEQSKQEAILANETKSRFLANMSHEIRTPINAILGMDEIILRENKDPKIRDYAIDILSAGRTLLSIINDILDFSKIESGKMELSPVEYDFSRLVMDLINFITPRVDAKGLNFITEIDENIPRRLYGDDLRLRQCITNILTNGVKYTQEGSVTLVISSMTNDDRVKLHFEIRDTGMGIKEEDLPKLFHAYERIEERKNRNVEGTGLGMNITNELLALMGSKLDVSSVYGEGSVFSFDVEQKIIDPSPVGKSYQAHNVSFEEISPERAFIAPDAHILVTDDNAINRKVFIGLLLPLKMQIDEADSGFEAIEMASKNPYDIIFMDHMMPNMDGIEAMQAIRALPDSCNSKTKIFVLTANAVTGAKEMYLEAGFDGFLSKPILSDKLIDTLVNNLPEDKMLPASADDVTLHEQDDNTMPDDLPFVDGIDWTFAWQHMPRLDLLETTVRQFYDFIPTQASKLCKAYDHLHEEGMVDAYRIQVHGMKSLAATVGIIPLAGMARILETAAQAGNTDTIEKLHDIFISEWNSYSEKLVGIMGIMPEDNNDSELEEAKYRLTLARLEMLRQAMDDYDVDQGDALIEELLKYRYPENISPLIHELKEAVSDIDSDRVSEIADSIVEMGEW